MKKVLKWFVCISIKLVCFIAVLFYTSFHCSLFVSRNKDRLKEKYKKYFTMLMEWMDILENNHTLEAYFVGKGIGNIAVYGAGGIGRHLLRQLEESAITVKYGIDKSEFLKESEALPLLKPWDDLPEVDAIVVTPVWDYQNIREQLLRKVKCPVISLDDVIKGMKDEQSSCCCSELPEL